MMTQMYSTIGINGQMSQLTNTESGLFPELLPNTIENVKFRKSSTKNRTCRPVFFYNEQSCRDSCVMSSVAQEGGYFSL